MPQIAKSTALGGLVRRLRVDRDWSMAELGRRSDMPRQRIYEIERGRYRNPQTVTLIRLADALGVSTQTLSRAAEQDAREA